MSEKKIILLDFLKKTIYIESVQYHFNQFNLPVEKICVIEQDY
jgi:hypothetical protein